MTGSDPTKRTYTKEEQLKANEAAVDENSKKGTLDNLTKDIEALVGLNAKTQAKFTDVGTKLRTIDNKVLPSGKKLNDTGKDFHPDWDALGKKFDGLVNRSNNSASSLGTFCQSFHNEILKYSTDKGDVVLPKDKKAEMLDEFIKDAKEKQQEATALKGDFDDLSKEVSNFGTRFDGFAETQIKNLENEVKKLDDDIADCRSKIKEFEKDINYMAMGIGLALFVTIAALALFPEFAGAILGAGGAAIGGIGSAIGELKRQIREKEAQIKKNTDDKAKLEEEIKELKDAQQVLGEIKEKDSKDITTALSSFSQVWQTVQSECQQVADWIKLGKDIPVLASVYIKKSDSLYLNLGQGMLDYAQLNKPNSSFSTAYSKTEYHSGNIPAWAKVHPAVSESAIKSLNAISPSAQYL